MHAAGMPAHLVVHGLRKRYGAAEALRGVSFEVGRGEIFGLLGPNGAGKTSVVEIVLGLRASDGGTIEIGGMDVAKDGRAARERVGAALQTTALQEKITVREALELFGAFYRERESAEVLLERFSLREKAGARFESLSQGQRQRLALALAFVNRPELLLLDEPTSGLDPASRRELHEEIRRMKAEGRTVLLTTHDLDEAEQLCDRIAIVDAGEVVATGTPRELIEEASGLQSVTLVTGKPLDAERLARMPGVIDARCEGTTARFQTAGAAATVGALANCLEAAGIPVVELHVQKATLEDVFLGLTAKARARRSAGGNEGGEA
jgi:ABC-type multidrug transport system, ATPase component